MLLLFNIFFNLHPIGKWKQLEYHYNVNIENGQHSISQQNFINFNKRKRFLFGVFETIRCDFI